MGKRSDFERIPRDVYPTPLAAVPPLVPHLCGISTFAEPCAGNGDLVRHLESHGIRCAYRGDIATGQDALAVDSYGTIDAIVTNPPWSRPLLHQLIPHFARIAPTWLLLDQDWAGTKQATPYLGSCSDILPIGRLIWIPGTTMPGKDNAAWYRFDARHVAGPVFHPFRAAPASSRATLCAQCGKPYRPRRSDSRFCSDGCRQRAHRRSPGASSRGLAVTKRDTPRVLNAKSVGQQSSADRVYVGRGTKRNPGKWGNRFKIGRDGTRTEVITKYRAWIGTQPELMAALGELRGKDLVCHCAPLACHADVLLELANREAPGPDPVVAADLPPSAGRAAP